MDEPQRYQKPSRVASFSGQDVVYFTARTDFVEKLFCGEIDNFSEDHSGHSEEITCIKSQFTLKYILYAQDLVILYMGQPFCRTHILFYTSKESWQSVIHSEYILFSLIDRKDLKHSQR